MKHLATIPFSGGLKISYLIPAVADQQGQVFTAEVSRVAIGVCFSEESCVAAVVTERLLTFDRRSERERRQGGGETPHYGRYFMVIDEAVAPLPQELIDHLIRLKDTYRASVIFGPDRPAHLVDSIRQTDGLTHYREQGLLAARLWPSFVDWDVVAGYAQRPIPDEETVHRGLELGLSAYAKNPQHGGTLLGKDGAPVRLLNLPEDFNNLKTRAAVRAGTLPGCTALWHVFTGLDQSAPRRPSSSAEYDHVGNAVTGY